MKDAIIGGRKIGDTNPIAVVAELGICHRGDVDLAMKMATYSAEAGADFIKFEIYQLDTALTRPYREKFDFTYSDLAGNEITMNMFEAYESGYLSFNKADELISHIKKLGKPFFATTTSIEEADFTMSRGACAVKLSSGEVDHIPLLKHCAQKNYPVFLDLAKCNLWEVVRACEYYQGHGGEQIVVMHNPVGYPAKPELIDLKKISVLRESLNVAVGYTCHSPGRSVLAAAIGMGARVVEKPISPDKTGPYIEYAFSENMQDYQSFVEEMHYLDRALGNAYRIWSNDELQANKVNRHGVVVVRDLKVGHLLTSVDIAIARPGFGIQPELIEHLPGRTLKRDLIAGSAVTWDDI